MASEWLNFEPRNNHFGESLKDGYGAPRALDERAGRDDEDAQTDDPSGEPTNDMTLTVKGRGIPANYRISIRGTAQPTDLANPGDRVRENDGTTTISGYVNKHQDNYDLGDDA